MPTETIKSLIANGAVVLDVRTREEFAAGAFPGALNIPVQELAQRVQEVPAGKQVLVYCAAGARAANAVQILKAAGYPAVTNCGGLRDMPR
jgi:rhodanese-related sulfurtransferase